MLLSVKMWCDHLKEQRTLSVFSRLLRQQQEKCMCKGQCLMTALNQASLYSTRNYTLTRLHVCRQSVCYYAGSLFKNHCSTWWAKWQCAEKFNSIHYSILPQFILICMIFEAFTIIIIVLKNISGQGETLTRACNKMPLELTKKRCTWYLTVRKSATILNSLRLVL